ncbi:hypothetical protein CYK66_00920 [Clostridium perfringens]|nr:hypothetical protein CYK66_00920 [Clostridium perfringens]
MKYRIYSNMGIWGWSDFRRDTGLKILDYNTTGNIVNYIDYKFIENLDKDILKKYEVKVEILDDNVKVTEIIDYRKIKEDKHTKDLFEFPKDQLKIACEKTKRIKKTEERIFSEAL